MTINARQVLSKVLIIDDNYVDLEFLREILKDLAETYLAVNGREAFQGYMVARECGHPFDLILLDMVMPEMDGVEFLASVREVEKQEGVPLERATPIIVVTGIEQPFMQKFNRGCDDYVLKPVDVALLREKVRLKTGLK